MHDRWHRREGDNEFRVVRTDELEQLIPLGLEFYEEQNLPGRFIPEVFVRTWTNFYNIGIGMIFGHWDGDSLCGAIGSLTVPDPNDGEPVVSEMFWFTSSANRKRGHGMKLLNMMEEWAEHSGAKRITMVYLDNDNSDLMRKLYTRRGYVPVETHCIKSLE